EKATDAFGELNFMGAKNKYAKYIRLSDKTEPSHIYDHLVEEWGLNPPNLIISVTGGASNFSMQSRLTKEFRRSLIKLAESTRAWIVTGGTNTGVMKHVGKAVNEHSAVKSSSEKVVTLGIATWGIVKNRKNLIRPSNDPEWQAEYNINPETINPKTESLLDLNHSHFILVDDGSKNKFGKEIELRTKLEAFIASKHSGNEKVLLVALIVQGGPGSLNVSQTNVDSIASMHAGGSSCRFCGWADILANITNPLITSVDEARIRELHEGFSQWTQTANECIAMKDMLNIYRLDSSVDAQNLDVAILQALLSGVNYSSNPEEKLNLSVAWNRSDLARSSILTDDTYIRLNAPFITAMKEDKHEFVKLFLNHGVDLSTIFPPDEILSLYKDKKMLEEKKEKILLYLLEKYSGSDKQPNVENTLTVYFIIKNVLNILQPKHFHQQSDEMFNGGLKKSQQYVFTFSMTNKCFEITFLQLSYDPLKELFQLCILLNRREMSFVLWESMKEKLSAAIAATKMLKSMAKKAEDKETVSESDDLQCHADDYEAHSIGILSECYNENEEKTGNLLLRRLPKWGNLTPLQIAVNAKDRAFVSHPAVQILLSQIWKGQLMENTHTLKIIFSALCFPLIFFLISFNGLSKEPTTDDLSSSSDLQEKGLISKENGSTKRSLYKREKFMYFYRAPVVTFWLHVLSYLVFLILFAYVILFNFHPFTPGDSLVSVISPAEFLLWAWVGVLMLDEIYEVSPSLKSLAGKIRTWFAIHWNKLDMLPIILFFIGIGLRFQPDIQVSRTFLAVSFMVYCWRILNIFVVYKALGPKLIMVGKMIKDMLFFLFILIVFLVSYGVASQALLYPNETDVGKAIQGVLSKPYWQIYGELFLSEIHFDPGNLLAKAFNIPLIVFVFSAGQRRCPEINRLVPVLSALYMLLASVLLLNLLIAMFSYTFESLTQNTYNLYKFQRYELLEAYYFRSSIMTPFSIFSYIYQLCHYVLTGCKKTEK
uniref:TRPM SLOG domain-containing protein n=1 Tax=Ciona savignyi TaxID=51511 RepID=H2ZBY8_CIOSA